jgi:hypothetical protein
MEDKTLFEDFIYVGEWWLPDNPEDKLCGTLEYKHNEGIILSLSGAFKSKPTIILGLTNYGEKITLIQVHQMKKDRTYFDSGEIFDNSSFWGRYLLIGKHIKNRDNKVFSSFYMKFTYLEHWLNLNPFKWEPTEKGGISVSTRDPIRYETRIESIHAKFSINSAISKVGVGFRTKFQLDNVAYIGIIPDSPEDLDWYLRFISELGVLLTLLIGLPIYPKYLQAAGEVDGRYREIGLREQIKIYSILFNPIIDNEEYVNKTPNSVIFFRSNFPKLMPEWKDYFNIILNNWFSKRELLKPVYELYAGSYFNPSVYPNVNFLNLLRALEAFHRRIYAGKISLNKRLTLLKENKPVSWFEYVMGKDESIIRKLVDTRNYLTHLDEKTKGIIFTDVEIPQINGKLDSLLSILLLEQLEAPVDLLFNISRQASFNPFGMITFNNPC